MRWKPVGVRSLEPAAKNVVLSKSSRLVTAGPGAGKTELLAQRALFLLQSGACANPRKILAISFKRDAAKNLAERVKERGGSLSRRFVSLTLDAFAKSLVDRFRLGLPESWRPPEDYEVLSKSPKAKEIRNWLRAQRAPQAVVDRVRWDDSEMEQMFATFSHGLQLPFEDGLEPIHWFGRRWWNERLRAEKGNPGPSFAMISRLAALVLSENPKIKQALHLTYPFVFLDEFQDTTLAQYDLIVEAFQGSRSVLTAVGDSKQRIMLWAGALEDVFEQFQKHFAARRVDLLRNYRSAPELVAMQHIIACALENKPVKAVASRKAKLQGTCDLYRFRDSAQEAQLLANVFEASLASGLKPRDHCVLVRQKPAEMISALEQALVERGIKLRDEAALQDLLTEPAVEILSDVILLATRIRCAAAWSRLTGYIADLNGWDVANDGSEIAREAERVLVASKKLTATVRDMTHSEFRVAISRLVEVINESSLRSHFPQYSHGSYLKRVVSEFSTVLWQSVSRGNSLERATDELIGLDAIPAMTIHKSKGLEFQIIVFIGLEDSSWWSFSRQPLEEKRNFFVAFSRAIQRVVFTYCQVRDNGWGTRIQSTRQVSDLFDILKKAGVPLTDNSQR